MTTLYTSILYYVILIGYLTASEIYVPEKSKQKLISY